MIQYCYPHVSCGCLMSFSSSCCPESQREAALLLGQFAATDSDCKVQFISGFKFPLLVFLWFDFSRALA